MADTLTRRDGAPSPVDVARRDPRPLSGYAGLLSVYGALAGTAAVALRRLITKDAVTSVLRMPFARFEEPAGEGEVNEEAVGTGFRHAVGELLTCPFCAAPWVATALVVGRMTAPNLTAAVVSVSAVARTSDVVQLLYGLARRQLEE